MCHCACSTANVERLPYLLLLQRCMEDLVTHELADQSVLKLESFVLGITDCGLETCIRFTGSVIEQV